MQDSAVCPYFDHDEDVCDVGCGYISSHDASMIIKFCSCHYQDCAKYRELADRLGHQHPELTKVSHPVPAAPSRKPDSLPVLGLFCYGVTAATYAVDKLPEFSFNLHLLAVILMLGAIGQISAGLNALKNNVLRAIAFTGSGLFWLSVLAIDILPRAGYGTLPGPVPMMGYFAMWGMFSLIICQGFEQLTRTCRLVFAMMTVFLLLLAMAHATANIYFLYGAVVLGLTSSLPGFYFGMRLLGSEARQLLHLELAKSGKIGP